MADYYFTYGTDKSQPYRLGNTLVVASSRASAVNMFRSRHKDISPCVINCAGIYDSDEFSTHSAKHESMKYTHEVIIGE